jgi:2-desacetyl-2-hydroxyethyl bacteriochlorophyllide A dehydrogenase
VCKRLPPTDFRAFQGAFASYVRTDAARLHRVPSGLSPRAAALTEPLAVALHGVSIAGGVKPGQRILVTGAGPIGLLTIAALRAAGADDVTVCEPGERRRERALKVGAKRGVVPEDLSEPAMGRPVAEPFELAFECSGRPRACEAAITQLDFAGTLVHVGTGSSYPTLNHNRVILLELTVLGALNYDADGFERALALLASGRLPLDQLIEPQDVGLGGLLDAMHRLAAGELAGKVMVSPAVEG